MKHKKRALFQSVISLILCLSMLVGTTFAWFTDSVSSTGNIIKSGNLKIEMEWTDDLQPEEGAPVWTDASKGAIFNYEHWEPGYTDLKYLQISNKGNLAFQYQLTITEGTVSEQDAADNGDAVTVDETTGEVIEGGKVTTPVSDAMKLAEVIDVYYANVTDKILTREQAKDQLTKIGTLADMINGRLATAEGVLLAVGSESDAIPSANVNAGSTTAAIMLKMRENAGNTYMGLNPKNGFSVQVVATQFAYEKDSFGKDYDTEAVKVELQNFSNSIGFGGSFGGSASIETDDQGMTTAEVAIGGEEGGAVIPAGVKTETGTTELTLAVTKKDSSEANITFGENENLLPLDVHITGISPDNTTPIRVNLGKVLPVGMNMGGVKLYHVENGVTNPMIQVSSLEEMDAHNEFYYDLLTGNVTVAMATFSEITLINDKANVWQGGMATSFAGGDGSAENPYIIANADQLAYLGDRISNDNGTYGSAHYKLISNVNIGGESNYSENKVIWYPIGYNKAGGEVAAYGLDEIYFEPISAAKPGDKDGDVVAAAGENTWYTYGGSFKGVFDGNGHTITGIYQNTWAMKGDYDGHYYNDAMGLFGYVNGGTVKNLTIDNFYSEGEFAPTGCVTAYAGGSATFENIAITNSHPQTYNTGVAGIVGWDNGNNTDFTFKNITVDSSNIISALWGSWDVAAAGILGSLKNDSRATFDNCHVSATIDVYNDVCGNYQYYWYRYCGAFIGTVYSRLDDGKGALDLSRVNATNCTVNFGERHEYYYCEFVENTIASYTHDYQMSRVPSTDIVGTGDSAVCQNHNHEEHGYETVNGQSVLVEDKQAVYLPFYQLFGGYGWGVHGIDLDTYNNLDIVADKQGIKESEIENSVQKFTAKIADYTAFRTETRVRIGDLFAAIANVHPEIDGANVQVTISPVGETSTASGIYVADTSNWEEGTLTFSGEGDAEILIQDYNYCEPTALNVTVRKPEQKFTSLVDVTTQIVSDSTKTLGELFAALEDAKIDSAKVKVEAEPVEGSKASGVYTADLNDWTQGSIHFSGEGVLQISITDDEDFCVMAITNVTVKAPKDKFTVNTTAPEYIEIGTVITMGDLFTAINDADIREESVKVTITAQDNNAEGEPYEYVSSDDGWTGDSLKFLTAGEYKIAITDNDFCKPTTVKVKVQKPEEKFVKKFQNENYRYRVGNLNPVSLSSLFAKTEDNVEIGKVNVVLENVSGNANGQYSNNSSDWKEGTITFSGTGVVNVSIEDDNCCIPTVLTLQVIDAVNATGATNATSNNVVLLNDCGFSSLEVSGGYTLYGNGFTMTCGSDSAALDMGYSFVTLNNGILDNVQIVCPNFDYAVLYKSNMIESGNRSETTDRTRYYNVKSGVMASGNSQILNSRISGARAAVNVTGGNVLIDNSRIELGAVASILVGSANSLTLRDVTLVQEPTASTYTPSKTLMGFSVLFICDADGNTAPVTLEGSLVQNAWVNESDNQYVPSAGQSIISTVLGKTEYLHDIDGDGKNESLNLGFAYMPESLTSKVNATTITDNRTDKGDIPYDYAEVSILNGKTYVYSYKNSNGTGDSYKDESKYDSNKYGDIITVNYSVAADGLESGKSFGTDGWVYELNVDLDKLSGYTLDFSKLEMSVNGELVTDYKVNGAAKPTSPVAVTAGGVTYTLTATVDGKDHVAIFKVTGTETSKESPSKISGPTTEGFGVAKSYDGDWSGAADVLTGVKIKYWSVAENKYVEFDFSNFTVPGNAGKLNGTNSYWEYTHTNNDFTLKVTNTVAIHSGKSVYGMPIRGTDGKLYFTISSTNGYVGTGTSSRAITMQYEFTDNNGGEKLTFTHTFNISYNKDDQYSYSDLSGSGKLTKLESSSSGGSSSSCVTPDTLITLANGKQVRVDSLTGNEQLLVWNLETGKLDSAPIMFVDSDPKAAYEVIHLYFSDGTDVKVISEHGFWDYDLNRYVYLDRYADKYIGHTFAKQNGSKLAKVKLTDVVLETEVTTAWSPVTAGHLCYFVNGMLSMPGGVGGLFNIFDVDPATMTYDYEAMAKDIETYGLFTYEEMNAMVPLSKDMFNAAGGAYLKISIGKGNMTLDDLVAMIQRYSKYI